MDELEERYTWFNAEVLRVWTSVILDYIILLYKSDFRDMSE